MDNINFILAKNTDFTLLKTMATDIWNACYPEILSQQQIDYMLNLMYNEEVINQETEQGIKWEIITVNSQNAGFLSYCFNQTDQKVKLFKLYIYPKFQGKAIGQAALQHVIQKAKEYHAIQVYLTVNKHNQKAINAYKRCGFYTSEEVVSDIGNGFVMDDYIMSIDI